jgi:hypothetical protein
MCRSLWILYIFSKDIEIDFSNCAKCNENFPTRILQLVKNLYANQITHYMKTLQAKEIAGF